MIVSNLCLTGLAFTLMLFCSRLDDIFLWIAVAMAGFAMSSTFAATFAWTSNVVIISGAVAGVLLAGASIGGMTGSVLAGYLFETYTHMWVVYLSSIAVVSHAIIFTLSCILVKYCKTDNCKVPKDKDSAVELKKQASI